MTEQEKTIANIFDKSVEALGIMTKSLCDAIKSTKTDLQTERLYTAEDMEAFAEWIGNNKYYVPFYNPMSDSIVWAKGGTRDGYIITAQLRELWEEGRAK